MALQACKLSSDRCLTTSRQSGTRVRSVSDSGSSVKNVLRKHRQLIDAGFSYDQASVILEVLSGREESKSISMRPSAMLLPSAQPSHSEGPEEGSDSAPGSGGRTLASHDAQGSSRLIALEGRLDYLELEVLKQVVGSDGSSLLGDSLGPAGDEDLYGIVDALKPGRAGRAPAATADSSLTRPARYWGSLKGSALRSYRAPGAAAAAQLAAAEGDEDGEQSETAAHLSARAHGVGILLVVNASILTLFLSILLAASA